MEEDDGRLLSQLAHSTTHPKYLHSNSTSHVWAFGAIAELADNALDAGASRFSIDLTQAMEDGKDQFYLSLEDNGVGMSPDELHRMLSFGHCEKTDKPGLIGRYGNGFKSGSMRLGKDALVFTQNGRTKSVGLLSQTLLKEIDAVEVLVPIISWDIASNQRIKNEFSSIDMTHVKQFNLVNADDHDINVEIVTRFTCYKTVEQLIEVFGGMPSRGTRIVIFNLKTVEEIVPDIDIRSIAMQSEGTEHQPLAKQAVASVTPPPPPPVIDITTPDPIDAMLQDGHGGDGRELLGAENQASEKEQGNEDEEEGEEDDFGDGIMEHQDVDKYTLVHGAGIEFDLSVRDDIQLTECVRETSPFFGSKTKDAPPLFSLRAYLAILYNEPKMQIWIRNQRVPLKHIAYELYKPMIFTYRRKASNGSEIEITYGFNKENRDHYGMMLYHNGRLINLYLRVGFQLSGDSRGVGVVGVANVNFLQPTHNKQSFICDDNYRLLIDALKMRLTLFWNQRMPSGSIRSFWAELDGVRHKGPYWVVCDNCFKWRQLPTKLKRSCKGWTCSINENPASNSCTAPEEAPTIQKFKKQRKRRSYAEIEKELEAWVNEAKAQRRRSSTSTLRETETESSPPRKRRRAVEEDGEFAPSRKKKRKAKRSSTPKRPGRPRRSKRHENGTLEDQDNIEGEEEDQEEGTAKKTENDEESENDSGTSVKKLTDGLNGSYWSRSSSRGSRNKAKRKRWDEEDGSSGEDSEESDEEDDEADGDEMTSTTTSAVCKECIRSDVRNEFLQRDVEDLREQLKEVQKQLQREEQRNVDFRATLTSLGQSYEL